MVIGKIRGGTFRNLGMLTIRRVELILAALIIEVALVAVGFEGVEPVVRFAPYIYAVSYLCLFAAIWVNLRIPGMPIIGLGNLLNFIVIFANGGHMPVSRWATEVAGTAGTLAAVESGRALTYTILTDSTRLSFLADIIPIPRPYPIQRVVSIGDLIMAIGVFILIQYAMKKRTTASSN